MSNYDFMNFQKAQENGPKLAVIGGTGVYNPRLLENIYNDKLITPYGMAAITVGTYKGRSIAFMARHGHKHSVPPHMVNYRANIWALKKLGVRKILSTTSVGSMNPEMTAGMFVLPDSFLDFTQGRINTFYDTPDRPVVHVDVSDPFCPQLRGQVEAVCRSLNIPVHNGGTYVCTNGPRFETSAEIKMFAQLGGDVVGMTCATEAALAAEAEMCYATISMVTNLAAGISENKMSYTEVLDVMKDNSANFRAVIMKVLEIIDPDKDECDCAQALAKYGGFKLM